VGIAAIFVLLGLLAVLLMPNFTRARTQAHSNAVVNNLRQIDGAKQQWALENKKSPDDVPTWTDLQPYLGREGRQVPSVRGEEYVLGQVAEPPVATVGGETKYTLDDGRELGLGSRPASASAQRYVADSRSDVIEHQVASARFGMATQPEPADRRYYFRGLAKSTREGGGAGAGGQGGFGGGGLGLPGRVSGPDAAATTHSSSRDRGQRRLVEIALPAKSQEEASERLLRRSRQRYLPTSGLALEQSASERWDMPAGLWKGRLRHRRRNRPQRWVTCQLSVSTFRPGITSVESSGMPMRAWRQPLRQPKLMAMSRSLPATRRCNHSLRPRSRQGRAASRRLRRGQGWRFSWTLWPRQLRMT
jgi:hypothetical protein